MSDVEPGIMAAYERRKERGIPRDSGWKEYERKLSIRRSEDAKKGWQKHKEKKARAQK